MATLQEFLKARSLYRASVRNTPNFSYAEMVPEVDPKSLYQSTGSKEQNGRFQVVADMVSGDKRARDMRNMTRSDYFRAFSDASQHQDTYEAFRLKRFESGGL